MRIGDIVTTEVPGLAEALRRPGVSVEIDIALTDGASIAAKVVIPDPAATLGLKAWARVVRNEDRDAEDLWRCLEIAHAAGVTADVLRDDATLGQIVPILERELGPTGASIGVITKGLDEAEAARRRTRIRALVAEVVGITPEPTPRTHRRSSRRGHRRGVEALSPTMRQRHGSQRGKLPISASLP